MQDNRSGFGAWLEKFGAGCRGDRVEIAAGLAGDRLENVLKKVEAGTRWDTVAPHPPLRRRALRLSREL
jgi:hypothetical protein